MKKYQKGLAPILVIGLVVLGLVIVGSTGYFLLNKNKQVACTMEAKICSDGSSVGRVGPNCEFATCPEVNKDEVFIQTNKWIYIGHDNFWGQPEHFPNSPDYFFPKIRIYYPEDWSFDCCTDTDGGSFHWISPPKDSTKEPADFYIGLKSISNFSCSDDAGCTENPQLKWQNIINDIPEGAKILENESFKNIEKERIFTYTYLNDNRPFKVFVVKANNGFLEINFANYDKLEPSFINQFLNKLELED